MTTLRCPLCPGHLRPELRFSIPLDVCDACGAFWFDPGEFPAYAARADRRPSSTTAASFVASPAGLPLPCPMCRTKSLINGAVAGVVGFQCKECGCYLVAAAELGRFRGPKSLPSEGGRPRERYVRDWGATDHRPAGTPGIPVTRGDAIVEILLAIFT